MNITAKVPRALAVLALLGSAALLIACDDDSSTDDAPAATTATPSSEATRSATASPTAAARVSPTASVPATTTSTPSGRAAGTASAVGTPIATASRTPRLDAFGEDIEAALARSITAKNYGAIGAYMTNPVRLTIESTGCCAPGTPAEAVGNLSRLNSATQPWNFDQDSAAVASIKTRYPDNYGGSYVGISANGQVAAFKFNAANLIESIRLGDTRLLGP